MIDRWVTSGSYGGLDGQSCALWVSRQLRLTARHGPEVGTHHGFHAIAQGHLEAVSIPFRLLDVLVGMDSMSGAAG